MWTRAGEAENHETTEALWKVIEHHTPAEQFAAVWGLIFRVIDPEDTKSFDWFIRKLYELRASVNGAIARAVN